jgi:hypothetical protein
MTRDYSLPEFLPPSWKEREAAAVAEHVDQLLAEAVTQLRGRRQVEHSRACIALAEDIDGCQGQCLPFVNKWAS